MLRGLWRTLRRRAWERELDDELRFHLDEHILELMAAGKSRPEAERLARRELGGLEQVRESVRDGRPTRWLEQAWSDARFAVRGLRGDPGFATVAIAALGLGIGASTAIFSVAYPVLFEPLPYPDSDRLAIITEPEAGISSLAFGTYRELMARSRSVEGASVFAPWQPSLSGDGVPRRLEGQRVSASFFDVLGVAPALGPGFAQDDDQPTGPDVVVLSHALWRDRFEADTSIVGRDVTLDGRPFRVAGIMPADFRNTLAAGGEAWTLLRYDASLPGHDTREWGRHLGMLARLDHGVSLLAAQQELQVIGANPVPEYDRPPWADMANGLVIRPMKLAVTAQARPLLITLLGAVGILLTIACANAANLVLGRNARRRGEIALRGALGASRSRIVGQLVVESVTMAALAGALGVLLAELGVWAMRFVAVPPALTPDPFRIDAVALAFAVAVTGVVAVAVGLVPALSLGRLSRRARIDSGSLRTAAGRSRVRRALVAAEIGLSLVLLIGAALLTGSLQRLFALPPGFDAAGASAMQIQISGPQYREATGIRQFYDEALAAARVVPGVAEAALTSQLPLSGDLDMYGLSYPDRSAEQAGAAYRYAVSPGYFAAMGIERVRGRVLTPDDVGSSRRVIVVSESAANRLFPGEDPLGQFLHFGRTDLPAFEIVGVVRDVKQSSLDASPAGAVYLSFDQWYFADRALWLVVRNQAGATVRAEDLRQAVWSVDPNQPVVRNQTLAELVTRSESERGFALGVFTAFAALAWALAGIGLYGVVSGAVNERRRELSVRSALGAAPRDIVWLVIRNGMAMTAVGVAVGLGGAAATSGAIAALLYGVAPLDAMTYVGTAFAVAAVSLVACWIPARRAASVDPATTLRAT